MPRISGIYVITCIATGQKYIGSSVNIEQRIYKHFYDLSHGDSKNKPMQFAYERYGKDTFSWEVVELVWITELKLVEQLWLNKLWGENIFNRSPTSISPKGVKHTEESIAKWKKAWETRGPVTEETKAKLTESALKRKPASAETREKIRLSKLGNTFGRFKGKHKEAV